MSLVTMTIGNGAVLLEMFGVAVMCMLLQQAARKRKEKTDANVKATEDKVKEVKAAMAAVAAAAREEATLKAQAREKDQTLWLGERKQNAAAGQAGASDKPAPAAEDIKLSAVGPAASSPQTSSPDAASGGDALGSASWVHAKSELESSWAQEPAEATAAAQDAAATVTPSRKSAQVRVRYTAAGADAQDGTFTPKKITITPELLRSVLRDDSSQEPLAADQQVTFAMPDVAPQVAAPSQEGEPNEDLVELLFKCRDLPQITTSGHTHPIIGLFEQQPGSNKYLFVGNTEWVQSSRSPEFSVRVPVLNSSKDKKIRIALYHADQPVLSDPRNVIGLVDLSLWTVATVPCEQFYQLTNPYDPDMNKILIAGHSGVKVVPARLQAEGTAEETATDGQGAESTAQSGPSVVKARDSVFATAKAINQASSAPARGDASGSGETGADTEGGPDRESVEEDESKEEPEALEVVEFELPRKVSDPTVDDGEVLSIKVACRKLVQMDWLSKSDPLVAVFEVDRVTGKAELVDATEMKKNNHDPNFSKRVELVTSTQYDKLIRFVVYDVDEAVINDESTYMGSSDVDASELVRLARSGEKEELQMVNTELDRRHRKLQKKGSNIVVAPTVVAREETSL